MSKFEPRKHETHISKANEWNQLQTKKEQDEFVKSNYFHWHILNNLYYWRPIDVFGIDIIHCLILGDIKYYCISFLKVVLAGHELELQRKNQSILTDSDPSKYPVSLLGHPRKRGNEYENDPQQLNRPKKQNLTKANLAPIWPLTSQRSHCSIEGSRTKIYQTEKATEPKVAELPTPGIPLDPRQPLLPY
ncbi:hypothetical protein O181_007408 [Austropuccinia psidii MF-1]|uniref:Uncharacterized protein n=1 Tax=Austropuccinia psidii MF-1 TaxID=1389203 RepID=A0A9Q3GHJ1_9BASI|nr:hypothetical protein [Austropuccinia psidii MF-1]